MGSYTVRVRAFACSNLHMKADADPGSDPTPPRGSPARVRPTQHAWIQPAAPPSNRATIIGCSQASATSHGSFCHRFRVCASAVGSTFLRSGIRVAVDRGRQASHGRLPFRGEDEANPPPGGSGGRGGGARARRPRAALRGVLLGELPHRTRRRAPSHVAGRHQRHPHRRRHPPPLLPRLLRQRLRRLAAARRHGHHARREELRPQRRRLHLRLRRHRQHQDAGRGRLPRHRLLRRHPRPRRARQRQPAGRAELGGAPGPARRDGPGPGRGEDAAGPGPGPRRSGLCLRRQGAHVARPGRALGRAHGRHGALRAVPHARLLRCQREPGLRVAAAAALSGLRRRRRPRAARPAHPQRVRQRILPQPHVRRRAAALRPGALQQRAAGLPGAALQRQPRRLLGGLRRLHDQPRQRQPAHGGQRGDQAGLQESQFLIYIHTLVYILEATCY